MAGNYDDREQWIARPDGFGQVDPIHLAGHSHIGDHQGKPVVALKFLQSVIRIGALNDLMPKVSHRFCHQPSEDVVILNYQYPASHTDYPAFPR